MSNVFLLFFCDKLYLLGKRNKIRKNRQNMKSRREVYNMLKFSNVPVGLETTTSTLHDNVERVGLERICKR